MSMDFLERLRNNCLTSTEDYRKMQAKLQAMKKEKEVVDRSGKSEEWKSWELAPLDAPVKQEAGKTAGSTTTEPSSKAVRGVHKALRAIDKY